LIGNKAFSSIGFKIQFFPDDESPWVANLGMGSAKLSGLYLLQSPNVLAVAGGQACIIDTAARRVITELGYGHYDGLVQDSDGTIILANFTHLTVVSPGGTFWNSPRISFDGIKDLKINDHVVTGLSYDPTNRNREWVEFYVDLTNRTVKGGSYNEKNWQT
jgi:hypothetical protein